MDHKCTLIKVIVMLSFLKFIYFIYHKNHIHTSYYEVEISLSCSRTALLYMAPSPIGPVDFYMLFLYLFVLTNKSLQDFQKHHFFILSKVHVILTPAQEKNVTVWTSLLFPDDLSWPFKDKRVGYLLTFPRHL